VSQQINLYEDRLRPRHDLVTARNLGVATLFVLVAMSLSVLWVRQEAADAVEAAARVQKQVTEEQQKLTALSTLVAQRTVSPALAAEIDASRAQLATRSEVVEVLDSGRLGNTSGFSSYFSGFARLAQNDLWLTGFQVAAGGEAIEIRGRMLDPARLPAYVQRLSSEAAFKGRRFAALDMLGVEPEEPKADVLPLKPSVPQLSTLLPPRYVEFTLRSEGFAAPTSGVRSGGKP
jgi:hypothetical protein